MPIRRHRSDSASSEGDSGFLIRFRMDAHTATDFATVVGAVESLIGAAAWAELWKDVSEAR
jgi:hypothetical protein